MKRLLILTTVLSLFLLSGCNGYREIDRGYLATAVGISENNGKTNVYIEAVSSQGFIDKSSQRVVLSDEGDDILSAYKSLTEGLVKPLYFEQLGTVVFDAALSTESVENSLKILSALDGVNLGIYLVKANEVGSLFDTQREGSILGYDIIGLVKNYEQDSGTAILNQLYHFRREGGGLPLISYDDDKLILKVG